MPWRPVVATVVLLAGAFCLFRGIAALHESATIPIPQQKSAANNYVKLDVPQPPLGNALYFGRCTMTAVYAHWDYPPTPADPDEHWAQDISIELTVADPSSVPSHLTLILAGTATTPNGLGANPSIRWSTADDRQVDGPPLADTVTWDEPYLGDHFTFRVPAIDRRFMVVLDSGYLAVQRDASTIRVLFRSDTKNPVGHVDHTRTTVDLPMVWEVSWGQESEPNPTQLTRSQINTFWGNPACATTAVTTRLKGSLTNASSYRLDSGSGTTTNQGIEFVRTVDHRIDYFYGQTIYSMTSPQLSFVSRNGEVAAQRTATIATSIWIGIGLGAIPVGLQAFSSPTSRTRKRHPRPVQ